MNRWSIYSIAVSRSNYSEAEIRQQEILQPASFDVELRSPTSEAFSIWLALELILANRAGGT